MSWLGRVRGSSAAGPGGRPPSFLRKRVGYVRNGRYGKIELDPMWTDQRQLRTYGNGERYFLRNLRSSYGILADERNSYVLLQRTTTIRERRNGYVTVETTHYSACKHTYSSLQESRSLHACAMSATSSCIDVRTLLAMQSQYASEASCCCPWWIIKAPPPTQNVSRESYTFLFQEKISACVDVYLKCSKTRLQASLIPQFSRC